MLTDYQHHCRPIRILGPDSASGPRLGGNPPAGVRPPVMQDSTRYFLTLVLDEASGRELSLFNSFESDFMAFLKKKYVIYRQDELSMVQAVVHDKSTRELEKSALTSHYEGRALMLEAEVPDEDGWLDSMIYQESKMGGYPFYYQNKESIRSAANELLSQGFVHLLQVSFPTSKDFLISGNWPYGPYILHVFADHPKNPTDIRLGWG